MPEIHESAVVGKSSTLGEGTRIGPYAVIEEGVEIGEGCQIDAHAVIKKGSILGNGVRISPFACVGGEPQDLAFDASVASGVILGDGCVLREGATVHRATQAGTHTIVGKNALLMVNSHVGHDCKVGDNAILANGALLAGHCEIGDHAFVSGNCILHQFTRLGESAMMSGGAGIGKDAAPYVILEGRNQYVSLNLVGLRRRGISREAIAEIRRCFGAVLEQPGNPVELATQAMENGLGKTAEAKRFLEFFLQPSKRGFLQYQNLRRR